MIAAEIIEDLAKYKTADDDGLLVSIINALREPVLIIDSSTRIVASNTVAQTAFGREATENVGRRLSEVIRDAELHSSIRRSIEAGEPVQMQLELLGADTRYYDASISPLVLKGEPHALAVFYDITKLERLERVRQEFLSNISHELRTPLTSILAFVETLEDGAIDDRENSRHFLNVIRRNSERMHALIADILELSLIESGKVSIEKRHVRVSPIVEEIFTSLSSKASARGITLTNQVRKEQTVFADPARLEQMLTNLIDNAIKFNRREGSVIVDSAVTPNKTILSVSDTGEGILPEHIHRIFERLYRADRGRAREIGGTGLGLAIVKHLARLHGGEVSAISRLTEGSVFTVELPLEPAFSHQ